MLLKYSISRYFELTNIQFLSLLQRYQTPKSKLSKHMIAKHVQKEDPIGIFRVIMNYDVTKRPLPLKFFFFLLHRGQTPMLT